jgi:hypothetical protein
MRKTKTQQQREQTAVVISLVTAVVAGIAANQSPTIVTRPPVWVPVVAGIAIGTLAYALIAPEC